MPSLASPRLRPARDPFDGRAFARLLLLSDLTLLVVTASVAVPGLLGVSLVLGTVAHLAARGAYHRRPTPTRAWEVVSAHASGVALALAAAAVLTPDRAVPGALVLAAGLGAVLVLLGRGALGALRHRARLVGRSGQPTLILGAGRVGAELERRLLADPGLGLRPVGVLDEDPAPAFWAAAPRGAVLGTPRELARVVQRTGARSLIVAFTATADADVLPTVRAAQALGLEVSVVPRLHEDVVAGQRVEHVGGLALCAMPAPNPRAWLHAVKHGFGRSVAAAITAGAAPLLLGLALAVRLSSPGPVLTRRRRVGRDGQVFELLGFRTVHRHGGQTALGALLRRSSLDELPQLLNVVRGHLSLVGPRPERPEFVALFGQEVRRGERHRVRSGMTGWAQLNGLRGATSIADRIALDDWYIANWSLWLDVKILLLTPIEVLRSQASAPLDLHEIS